jgi:hypothetical protein
LKADIGQFEVNLPELKAYQQQSYDTRHRINILISNIERDILTSADYGPAAYQTTFTATVALRAIYKYASVPQEHQNLFFGKIGDKYSAWLKPVGDGYPAYEKNQGQANIDIDRKKVAEIISGKPSGTVISGDLDSGFKVSNDARLLWWQKVEKPLADIKQDYDVHAANVRRLDSVLEQLTNYREALQLAAQGHQLALK